MFEILKALSIPLWFAVTIGAMMNEMNDGDEKWLFYATLILTPILFFLLKE